MPNERDAMRAAIRRALRKESLPWHATWVESPRTSAGAPDLHLTWDGMSSWVELKALERWPARRETRIRIRSLTELQILWAEEEFGAGGAYRLLLRVGTRDWVVLRDPVLVARLREPGMTKAELALACNWSWTGPFSAARLMAGTDPRRWEEMRRLRTEAAVAGTATE